MRVFSVLAVLVALFFLGESALQTNAESTPRNATEYIEQLRAKAERGDTEAQNLLGGLYYFGQGVPLDDAKAYMWFSVAAGQGSQKAIQWQDIVARSLTPAQIAEAQRLAREWLAAHPKAQGEQ